MSTKLKWISKKTRLARDIELYRMTPKVVDTPVTTADIDKRMRYIDKLAAMDADAVIRKYHND